MISPVLIDAYALAVGLVVGSYLNVVAYRLPRGLSTVRPRSRCPWCAGSIRARDNIPVVSWVALHGRCRRCAAPISWRYPTVEAATGLLFLACALRFGASPQAATGALFCALLTALALIDLDHYLLPDRLTLPGVAAGVVLSPWLPASGPLESLTGAVIGAGILILVINVWYWLRGEEGMGLGDVNMLAMIGAFLGWRGALQTLMVGAVLGAVTGLALVATGRLQLRSRLPFGLFLAAGGVVVLLLGDLTRGLFVGP